MNNKKFKGYIIIVTSIFFIFFTVGCTSDTEYNPPSEVEPTSNIEEEDETPTESQKVQTFNIGDTATDDELKITVNNVRFTTKIDEVDNEYLVAEASSGKQYVIVDITVENILSNKTQSISTSLETEVIDSEGYTYDSNFNGEMALDKAFKDGEILPGMKKRGELVYEVPMSAEDLTFAYKFDLFGGTTALFDIK